MLLPRLSSVVLTEACWLSVLTMLRKILQVAVPTKVKPTDESSFMKCCLLGRCASCVKSNAILVSKTMLASVWVLASPVLILQTACERAHEAWRAHGGRAHWLGIKPMLSSPSVTILIPWLSMALQLSSSADLIRDEEAPSSWMNMVAMVFTGHRHFRH